MTLARAASLFATVLAACGGGGGGSDDAPIPDAEAQAIDAPGADIDGSGGPGGCPAPQVACGADCVDVSSSEVRMRSRSA